MRKFRILIALLISQSFFLLSSPAFASEDQPVNCRDVVVDQQPIYGGLSVCYYTHSTGQIFRIEEYVVPNIGTISQTPKLRSIKIKSLAVGVEARAEQFQAYELC